MIGYYAGVLLRRFSLSLPALVVAACATTTQHPIPTYTQKRSHVFHMSASASRATRDGIVIQLRGQCERRVEDVFCDANAYRIYKICKDKRVEKRVEYSSCPWTALRGRRFILTAPWLDVPASGQVRGQSLWLRVPWSKTQLDPLGPRSRTILAAGGEVLDDRGARAFRWKPSERTITAMLERMGAARGTETVSRPANGPVALVVTELRPLGTLRAGRRVRMRLTVTNKGPGTAYRVIATTRSGLVALHKLRFSVGMLKPGQRKTRERDIQLPLDADRTAMVVVLLDEANHATARHMQRFAVAPAMKGTVLSIRCKLGSRGRPVIHQGQPTPLICGVTNTGDETAHNVTLSVVGANKPVVKQLSSLKAKQTTSTKIMLRAKQTQLGARVSLSITARGGNVKREGIQHLRARVVAPVLCPAGRLTRAAYTAKLRQLRAALKSGALSQQEFDRYDAALVMCLN